MLAASILGCRQQPPNESAPLGNAAGVPARESAQLSAVVAAIEKTKLAAPALTPHFVDLAAESGVRFQYFNDEVPGRYFLPEVMGGGVAWFDADLDGWIDLYFTNGVVIDPASSGETEQNRAPPQNAMFRNRGDGRFDEVSEKARALDSGYGQGCCIGDFNADGFPDIYVCNYGNNALFRNQGDGTFSDVTSIARVESPRWSTSALWLDLNNDTYLDLFVASYLDVTLENTNICDYNGKPGYCGPGQHKTIADHVFLNNGNSVFTESAAVLGLAATHSPGLAVAAVDLDDDLLPEIYVANDMAENFLYHRPQPGRKGQAEQVRYSDMAMSSGCAVSADGENEASMGVACGDFDGDGRVDLFLTHYYAHKNTLYRNLGGLLFQDDSRRTQIAATSFETLGFGAIAFDYDQNGGLDLFVANGHVLGPLHTPNEMQPQLLHNDGTGRFSDVGYLAGEYFSDHWLGRGAAGADYDNDGDVDLVVTHLHRPAALLRNDTSTPHHFLGLELRTVNRIPPVGGRVVITAGEREIRVPVTSGGSYLSCGDPRLQIGLGSWDGAVDIDVYWPSGAVDSHTGMFVDRYWRITQGAAPEPVNYEAMQAGA